MPRPDRICPNCGLALLGWLTHDTDAECVRALRGKYEALRRAHKTAVRQADSKADGMERWRIRARIAESRVAELERDASAFAQIASARLCASVASRRRQSARTR